MNNKPKRFKLAEIENMPTISQGHFDNLKLDNGEYRVWLSRMTVEDGMPYNNEVTVEQLINGVWTKIDEYEAQANNNGNESPHEIEEIKQVLLLIPKFIQTVENDLGEDNHIIEGDPLTFKDFDRIQRFANKLNNCINFVDVTIFE